MPPPTAPSSDFKLAYCPACQAAFAFHSNRMIRVHGLVSVRCPGDHQVWLDRTEVKEWDNERDTVDRRHYSSPSSLRSQWLVYTSSSPQTGPLLRFGAERQTALWRILQRWKRWRASGQQEQREAPQKDT